MLLRTLGLALLLAALPIIPGEPRVPPPSADEVAVREALQHYLQGHATGSPEEFRQALLPAGTMYFLKDGVFTTRSFTDYIAGATGKPAADESKRRRRIEFVDVTGNAAIGKIVLEYPGVTLTDYMELLKVDGQWRIVAKSFHAERLAS